MFQICVPDQKVQRKKTSTTFLKLFLNAMIRNIKINNILDIIEISKSMESNEFYFLIYENVHLSVSYDFSKFDGLGKIKV
jgi:hypothetical protein